MKMVKAIFLIALLALFASQAAAADPVYFRAPLNFAGTGCPAGTIAVSGENTDTLTVMFDQYDAAKPKSNAASKMWRTSCNFAVPVHVPQGFQASIMTIDWMGYAEGQTELRRKYFFAGSPFGPSKVDHPVGDYVLRDAQGHVSVVWSKCGTDVQLRLNSSIKAKSNPSYIAVDTVDLKNKIIFQVQWQKCR